MKWKEEREDVSYYAHRDSFYASMRAKVDVVLKQKRKPHAIHGVEVLENLHLLPLSADSPSLGLLNLLSCSTFWNGSIGHTKGKDPRGTITVKKHDFDNQKEIIGLLIEGLGCQHSFLGGGNRAWTYIKLS